MAAATTGVVQRPTELYGGTFIDPVEFAEDVHFRDLAHDYRLSVGSGGIMRLAKWNDVDAYDLGLELEYDAQDRPAFGFGRAAAENYGANFDRAIWVHGEGKFAGNLVPQTDYFISPYSVGTPDSMWYSGHFAELQVNVLVADEQAVTMGGRQLVGLGNQLAVPVGGLESDTKVIFRYNNVKEGDVLHFQGPAPGYLVAVEFMKALAHPAADTKADTGDGRTTRYYRTVYVRYDPDTGEATTTYPVQAGDHSFPDPADDQIVAYEYEVRRNYEEVNTDGDPTDNPAGASANAWGLDVVAFNTGTVGTGVIDIHAVNRLLDMEEVFDGDEYPNPLSGPAIEFLQRVGDEWNDIASRAVVGRLDGAYDYPTQVDSSLSRYGIAAGDYDGNWFAIDPASGFRMMNADVAVTRLDGSRFYLGGDSVAHPVYFDAVAGEFRMGSGFVFDDTTGTLTITANGGSTAIEGDTLTTGTIKSALTFNGSQGASTPISRLDLDDGSGHFARERISWTGAGLLTVGSWNVDDTEIFAYGTGGLASTKVFALDATPSAPQIRIRRGTTNDGSVMRFGAGVFGNNAGLHIDGANYWYDDGAFLVGGSAGVKYAPNAVGGRKVTLGSDTAVTGNLTVESGGDIEVKGGGSFEIIRHDDHPALTIQPYVYNGDVVGANIDTISTQDEANAANRYGLRVFDKPQADGGRWWILFQDPAVGDPEPASKSGSDGLEVVYTDETKTTQKTYKTAGKDGSTVGVSGTHVASDAPVPDAKLANKFVLNHEGDNRVWFTTDGDVVLGGRLQVSANSAAYHNTVDAAWGGSALPGQIRGSYIEGVFRPQWFDGDVWRWMDLGNDPNDSQTVLWSNVGQKPTITVNQGIGGASITGTLDLTNNTLVLSGGGMSQTTADDRYLNEDSNLSDLPNKSSARANLGVPGKAVAETITGLWDFNADVDFLQDVTVGQTLGVTGAASFSSTLAVSGKSTFSDFIATPAPQAPASLSGTSSGDTITVTVGKSPTEDVTGVALDGYRVEWKYADEAEYRTAGLLTAFTTATATLKIDGLRRRANVNLRAVALKNGVESSPRTATVSSLAALGDVTNVVVEARSMHFEIRWDLPDDARVGGVVVRVANAASAGNLTLSDDFATIQGSADYTESIALAIADSLEYPIAKASRHKPHRFWVETVARV